MFESGWVRTEAKDTSSNRDSGEGQGDVVCEVVLSHQWDEINAFCWIIF